MKRLLKKYPAMAWGVLCTALLFAATWLFFADMAASKDSMLAVCMLKALGDAALFMAPYWLLRGRWRGTALIPLWGLSLM